MGFTFAGVTNDMRFNARFAFLFFFFFLLLSAVSNPVTSVDERDLGDDSELIAGEITEHEDFVRLWGYGEEKISSVLVVASVLCNPCLGGKEFVSGADVVVRCRRRKTRVGIHGSTDKFGDFTVELPSEIHAWLHLERTCRIKVIKVPPNSTCYPRFLGQPTHMRLSSVSNGVRTFNAGDILIEENTGKPRKCHDASWRLKE